LTPSSNGAGLLQVLDASLEYRWAGEPKADRPTIVLLHEGLGSLSMWKDFPDRLSAATGCAVFTYSRQGYGRSSKIPAKREPDYMHREGEVVLPAVLDAAGISRPVLFGHSDGGSIALIHAAAHPDDVAGLILEAPHTFVERLTVDSIAVAKTVYETTDLGLKLGRYHQDADHAFWGWNDIWLDPRFLHWNIEDRLAAITSPILLIQGIDDEYGTRAQLDSVAARAPQAEILLVETCGHSPHRDQLDTVLHASRTFIDGLAATALAAVAAPAK
jgi:pimeloyl-ACP methyl ester carboxylesterase